jgi:eukaryotic-like serine/threonine-protein kinase
MTLSPGTRLGPYEILSPLGAGGMGEVYRAQDTRLERTVALKVLPEEFFENRESIARFEREAKALAAVTHPNIAVVFSFEEVSGRYLLIQELLEGETLREALARGPLPLRKALDTGYQVAEGLAAAHGKGIVHRDVKPENIFLTKDGHAKLLDFGLARHDATRHDPADTRSPTLAALSEKGVVLGTVAYMSPEQVRGESVDARSDIFSFGVVLYEMLSSRRPFKGDTAVQTMAAILEQDPPELTAGRGPMPLGLERIVGHCLEKNSGARFQSMKDIAFDLQNVGSASVPAASRDLAGGLRRARWQTAAALAGAMLLVGLILGFTDRLHLGRPAPPPTFRRLTYFRGTLDRAAFANHGQTIIYSAQVDGRPSSLYSLSRGAAEPTRLGAPGTHLLSVSSENDLLVLRNPRIWGGQNLGTLAQATQAGTGLREIGEGVYQADWAPDAHGFALARISDADSFKTRIEFPLGKPAYHTSNYLFSVRVSPNGKHLLFLEKNPAPDAPIFLRILGPEGNVETLADGRQVGSAIWGVTSREIWLAETEGDQTTLSKLSLSGSRKTLWRGAGRFELQGMDDEGRLLLTLQRIERQVETAGDDPVFPRNLSWLNSTFAFAFSRDGQALLFNESNSGGGNLDGIYLRRAQEPTPARLGSGVGSDLSPDGRMVLGVSPEGQFQIIPTGAGSARNLDTGPGTGSEGWFFPDGRRLLLDKILPNETQQMVICDLDQGSVRPAAPPEFTCFTGQRPLSQDGTRMALFLRDPKTSEVSFWIFPVDGEGRTRVSGIHPTEVLQAWSEDGQGLYVFERGTLPTRIDRVDIATGRREPWRVFVPADPAGIRGITNFEMTRDGKRVAFNYKRVLSQLLLVEGLK